ncbi:MAG TPA: DEAD/DEAH box helicase [Ktedonobacterales bacterium]|nr:DEAD/DEAH box helicase [Ktedonobacterales bacterium]
MTIHVSAAHKMIGVPFRPDVANLFPDAPKLTLSGNELICLPHREAEVRLLRQFGLEAPAPILTYYDWPHPPGKPPFEKQRITAALMTTCPRAYNLNGMGTGKTRTTLWSFDHLKRQGLANKMIVVAPLSTLSFVWEAEIFVNFPNLKCQVLHGDKKRRLKRLAMDADVYIINHDGVSTIIEELEARADIDVVTADELAAFRNGTSKRNKMLRRLVHPRKWAWGLTGSPTPESPTDVWGQCQIMTPNTVHRYFGRFRDQLMTRVTDFKYVPRPDAVEQAHKAMQPSVRFTIDDITELPELVIRQVEVEMGPRQKKIYDELRKHAYAMIQSKEITAVNAGAVLSKLLQVSLGYVYSADKGVVGLDNDKRIQAIVDIVESVENKVIVFAAYRHALEGFAAALKDENIEVECIHGDVSTTQRNEVFRLFQHTNRVKVIVADPRTMSHGLTLTAADTIVWAGPYASLETYEQANARIRRIGQTKKQQILLLQSTAAERKIYTALEHKQKVQNDLLSLFEEQKLV